MERRRRNEEKLVGGENKRLIYIVVGVLIVAVLAFVITFLVYSNNMSVNPEEPGIGQIKMEPVLANQISNEQTSQVSSSVGKNVNEMMENDIKIAINTTNMEKEKVTEEPKEQEKIKSEKSNVEKNESEKVEKEQKEETEKENKEPVFTKPVEGEISVNFAKDNLVYSETLQEWVTHNGIDINAEKTTVVKASADGTVKAIKNDPRYGITVILQHQNGYETVYSNLLTAEFVKEGENVTTGQTLGTVGNTATFEIAQEPHLHFEILKDGENVDPNLYIK